MLYDDMYSHDTPIDARLSKMEAPMENIASLMVVGNLVVNQLIEREVAAVVTTKATYYGC